MASFSEWSNNRKKETQDTKASSFASWSNQKKGIETPVPPQTSRNTAFENSGKTRDEYDSSVRQNYAARTAASATPSLKTASGYYSQPTLGADTERLRNTYTVFETRLNQKKTTAETSLAEFERLQSEMTAQGEKVQQMQAFAQENGGFAANLYNNALQRYNELAGQTQSAYNAATSAAADFDATQKEYMEAVNAYNEYVTGQQKLYDEWRGTVRADQATIQADIDGIDAAIEGIEEQQKALRQQAQALMNNVSARRGGTNELMQWSQQAQALYAEANAMDAQIAEQEQMKALLQEELDWSQYYRWNDHRSAEDFDELSVYDAEANSTGITRERWNPETDSFWDLWKVPEGVNLAGTLLTGEGGGIVYDDTGYKDLLLAYINGDETAGAIIRNNDANMYGAGSGALGQAWAYATEGSQESQHMTEDEIALFNYLYNTQGSESAYEYYTYIKGDLYARNRAAEEEMAAQWAQESPVGSSVFSVLMAPAKGLSYLVQAAEYLGTGSIDQNAPSNKFSYMNTAIRNEVSNTIKESGNWGPVGSFAYDTGMSMADFLFTTAISGGFSGGGSISSAMALGIMGTGAAADTVISAKDRGLDDNQAFALGTIAGAAEVLTEKFSMDALLKGKWNESAIKYILKNAVTEGSEEVGADVINTMADILIAKDQSQWQLAIDAYMAEGKTEGEAFGLALRDQALEMGLSFLGGFLSGGTLGGAGAGIGNLQQTQDYIKTGESLRLMGDEMVQTVIDSGLETAENTEAHKLALQMQEKLANGKIKDAELGKLFALASRELESGTTTQDTQQTVQPEVQEVPEATLPTGDTLQDSARQYNVPEQTVQRVQRIAEAVGRSVAFYEGQDASENGCFDNDTGTIYVNTRSQNPVAQIISHELTHSLEQTGAYESFQRLVLNRIRETGGDLESLRAKKAELYASKGVPLETQAEIDQEIVAEYVERNLLTDEQSIRQIVKQDRTVGERILSWLNDLIAKLGNRDAQQRAFLTQARNLYATALQESQTSFTQETAQAAPPQQARQQRAPAQTVQQPAQPVQQPAQQTETGGEEIPTANTENDEYLLSLREQLANGEITEQEYDRLFDEYYEGGSENQYSFGGRNANTADLQQLSRAQEMERQGVAAETIFRETGWYTGADGKWRFEIDDSGMEYNPRREEDGAVPGQTLADFLKHDELFRSYPQLRKTRLEFAQMEPGVKGQFNPGTNTITLSEELRNAPEGTLIHEIQHAIQRAEGFASGANTQFWERQLESGFDGKTQMQRREVQRLWQEYNSIRDNEPDFFAAMVGLEAMAPDVPRGEINWDTLEQIEEDPVEWQRYDAAREKLEQQYGEMKVWDFTDLRYKLKQAEMNAGRSATDLYYDTAGEVKARDAASRRTMTAEERRSRMPNTGNEDTVFTEDAVDDWLDMEQDAGYNERTENAEGGVNYGREMGDNPYRGRDAALSGERSAEGTGQHREGEGALPGEGRAHGDRGENLLREDSEGRRLTEEEAEKLAGTAIVDNEGHPLAVYHFTPEMDFETFERGDIGFRFGTQEQADQRGKDLKAETGRMFRAYLNIQNPYRVRLDLNCWQPSHIGLYLWSEGVITDAEWNEVQELGGRGYEAPSAQRLRELLAERGIDGIAYPNGFEGDGDSYIAFEDAQIVRTDVLPVKRQFSLSEPVERAGNLIALHNMDGEKIDRTLSLGAWPSPSIAIVEASQGHSDYGEYSAVFSADTIDPEADSRNKVYGSDAWTPTHNQTLVESEVDYGKKREFERLIEDLSRDIGGGVFNMSSVLGRAGVNDSTKKSIPEIAEQIAKYPDVQAAYLATQGEDIEVQHREKNYHKFGNEAVRRYAQTMTVQELAALDVAVETRDRAAIEEAAEQVKDVARTAFEETLRSRRTVSGKPISEEVIQLRLNRYVENISDFDVESFIQSAWEMVQDGAETGEIDKSSMVQMLSDKVDKREVKKWAEDLLEGLFIGEGIYNDEDVVTDNGRRTFAETHVPVTAENLVEAMYRDNAGRGVGAYGMEASGLQSAASPSYKTVDEIRGDSYRLGRVSEEEMQGLKDEINDRLNAIYDELYNLPGASAYNLSDAVINAASLRYVDDVIRSFEQDGIRAMGTDTALELIEIFEMAAQLPTEYFEAKPERVVELDEAVAVVAPDDAPVERIERMRAAGMNVVFYQSGNEQDRLEKVNGLNTQFSISEREYNRSVVLEESTVDKYLKDYATRSPATYAQAYIAYMTPLDFIDLTTSYSGRKLIESQSRELDPEEIGDYNRQQPIMLNIDHETGEVFGHEGRHRMQAMMDAGIVNVPVLLFDSSNKYDKAPIESLKLTGQDFGSSKSYGTAFVYDILPLSYENRDAIIKQFATQNQTERFWERRGRNTLRYSIGEQQDKKEVLRNLKGILDRGGSAIDLRRYVDTLGTQETAPEAADTSAAAEIVREAHGQNMSVDEYLRQNWEMYDRDGRLNEDARAALELEKRQSGRRYSVSDDGRVFTTPRGVEVVQNPTSSEYRQMREEAYREFPWLRGTGEPMLRHTYDEAGNEYYWRADQAMHSQVEPYINQQYNTRTSQQWQWWTREDKDDYPTDYTRQYSVEEGTERENLTQNARQYLKRAERALLNKVSKALSVPSFARREYLEDIVRGISDEYLKTGTVSQETIDDLFETAYDQGIEVDEEYYREYKHIKDHLRTQAITISDTDKSDIADFNDFRKSAFGTLRIVNSGGLPVDVAYQELQGMVRELFPDDYVHPGDQLMHMFEVARSIQKVEKSLDEYHGHEAEEFRKWAKMDFDAAVQDALGDLKLAKRYAEQTEAPAETLTTQEEVAEAYKGLKEARRAYEKAAAKNLLTEHDQVQVGRLLKGEIELEHLDPKKDNIKGITAVYEAKREYERLTRLIKEWNNTRRAGLREQADEYLRTANDWKDKKAGILYSRETMERNIRDIVKDGKLADDIVAEYFTPVHEAQAKSTRLKNRMRERVLALNLSTKETKAMRKAGQVSEAHAVQLLGEAMDNIKMLENSRGRMEMRDGKTLADWRGIVADLWASNPQLDKAKIENAVEEFRKIYDELFQMMNESRLRNGYEPVNYRKGYFPHFQPGDGDGIMGLFGRALGIQTNVSDLPTTINGLTHTFRPGIQWFGNAQERVGFETVYDAVEGFDRYIEGVADVIYQTDNIQKLRALATQVRYRTGDEGIRKQVDAVYADPTLSEQDKQNRIEKIYETGRYALSNFVVELEEYTNLLANKKSRADRNMEQALGRNMYNLVKALEGRVAANMVAINPASWLTNFIPLTQGGAMLNRGELLKGMWQTLQSYKESDGIVDASTFLTNRRGSDPIVKTWAQRASSAMAKPMEYIDHFTADSLVRARYNHNLKRGLSEAEAMAEADAWTAGVIADRSKGSTPTLFNRHNPLTKIFTQFQLEVNNQFSYLFKDMPKGMKEKGLLGLAAALIKFFLGAWLYDEVYEYFIGRRPALDPIGLLNDTVGDITGYELPNLVEIGVGAITGDMPNFEVERQNAYDTATNLLTTAAEELPFIGGVLGGGRVPISSAMPDWDNLLKTLTSDSWSSEKKWATAGKELLKPASYLLLPFGGGQLKKIYQGLDAVIKGGSYSVDAEGNDLLQYPVYTDDPWQTALNAAQAMVFGKTALDTGRDWIESGFNTMGAKETATYQALTDAGVDGETAYGLLTDLRGAEKSDTETEAQAERRILQESDIPGDGKSVVYYGLMATDKERALMDTMTDMDADMGEVTQVLMAVKDANALTGAAASNAKRDALADAALTDDQQREMYRYLFGTQQDDGSYTSSRDDDIMAFQQVGLDMGDFLEAQSQYTTIGEENDGAGDKATEFSRWVNSRDFTPEQAETVKECFKYYSQIPAQADRYEKFVGAGLDDSDAYELANTIGDLTPAEGKDSVTDEQKWRAVVDSGLSEDDQLAALEAVSTESQYRKFTVGSSFSVKPEAYVTAREILPQFDADGNGSYKNAEIEAALDSLTGNGIVLPGQSGINLTNDQKAVLWQLLTGSTSGKNNPYSSSIGWDVVNAVAAAKEAAKDNGIILPGQTGGIVLPEA